MRRLLLFVVLMHGCAPAQFSSPPHSADSTSETADPIEAPQEVSSDPTDSAIATGSNDGAEVEHDVVERPREPTVDRPSQSQQVVIDRACQPIDDAQAQRQPSGDRPCKVIRQETDRVIFERLSCYSEAHTLTRDGFVVGGQLNDPITAFRWSCDTVNELGPGRLRALADDGTTAVGLLDKRGGGAAPGHWRAGQHGTPLENHVGQGRDITPDGRYATGFAVGYGRNNTALRWDLHSGDRLDLGNTLGRGPYGENVTAGAISDDGQAIVGSVRTSPGRSAFVWTKGVMTRLHAPMQSNFASAAACNTDCSIIGGLATGPSGRHEATRWLEGRGHHPFPLPEGASSSDILTMDASGNLVGGQIFFSNNGSLIVRAYLWDSEQGFRFLRDEVRGRGLDTGEWRFWSVADVSADGTVLVGRGSLGSAERWNAYRVTLR